MAIALAMHVGGDGCGGGDGGGGDAGGDGGGDGGGDTYETATAIVSAPYLLSPLTCFTKSERAAVSSGQAISMSTEDLPAATLTCSAECAERRSAGPDFADIGAGVGARPLKCDLMSRSIAIIRTRPSLVSGRSAHEPALAGFTRLVTMNLVASAAGTLRPSCSL